MSANRLTIEPAIPVLILLSGMTGSGKSTLAARLDRIGVARVSVDELVFEAHGAYGKDYAEPQYLPYEREAIAAAKGQIAETLASGHDVVYDHGLWTNEERTAMSAFAVNHSAVPVSVSFPVSRSVIEQRLRDRNSRTDAHALFVSEEALNDFYARYNPIDLSPGSIVDGTADLARVVQDIRSTADRPRRTNDPVTDLILDRLLRVLWQLKIPVEDADSDVTSALDSLDVAELTVAIETALRAPISPGEILAAATPVQIAVILRGVLDE